MSASAHSRRHFLATAALAFLSWTTVASAGTPSSKTFFGAFPPATESVHTYNVTLTSWLLDSIEATRSALARLSESRHLSPDDVTEFRSIVRNDGAHLRDDGGAGQTPKQAITSAQKQVPALEQILRQAPDAASRRQVERNIAALRLEIELLEGAQQRAAVYARRLEDLDAAAGSWLGFWKVTEAARGTDVTRRQLADLVAQEERAWSKLHRREITEAILSRGYQIPPELPSRLQESFRQVERQLPRLRGELNMGPNSIYFLDAADITNGVSILFETSCEARGFVTVTGPEGDPIRLEATETATRSYRATWHPPFLSDTTWHDQIGRTGHDSLGAWQFRIEVLSDLETAGCEVVTDSSNLVLVAAAKAPLGLSMEPPPRKPKFLKKYPHEQDIPLKNKHHYLAILSYPILGLPRDAVDAVFGVVDKIPYVSLPINLVYAVPGQLLCKPWWDDEYKPFAQQSAGYYSWGGWDHDDWRYFENAKTWYWPKEDGASFFSGILYIGLGLPRDIVDVPFGWLDQIPYLTTPVSYLYGPVTVATKPWYADRYTLGKMKGEARVAYCEQSKHVVCFGDWWEQSQWVFFENFKTTTFRSPNTRKQTRLQARHREELAAYQKSVRANEERNATIRDSCIITLGPPEARVQTDRPVTR